MSMISRDPSGVAQAIRTGRNVWQIGKKVYQGGKMAQSVYNAFRGNGKRKNESGQNAQKRRKMANTAFNERPGGDNVQRGSKRSGKRVSAKSRVGKKKVKISRSFRKKVKQVIENASPRGYYQERFLFRYVPTTDAQSVFDIGRGFQTGLTGVANGTFHFFDPVRVLDAASVLFNTKTPVAEKALTDTNNFDRRNIQVNVIKQWVQFEIKNLSARRLTLKFYTWELKKDVREDPQDGGIGSFSGYWLNAFATDGDSSNPDGRINVGNISPFVIGANPMLSPAMKRAFNMEEKIVNLEPGKTMYHNVQGPRQMYDFTKFWERGNFIDDIKGTKGCCMVMYPDTITLSAGGVGQTNRLTKIEPQSPFGVCIETIYNYVIQMPEQAGFQLTTGAVGSVQQVQLKKRRNGPYYIRNWNTTPAGDTGTAVEIDDENPQNQAQTGL